MGFRPRQLTKSKTLQDAKCNLLANDSQQNGQKKAYSCLKTNCLGKWKEFHAEKRIRLLLTGSIVVFALRMSWQNGVFWPQGSLLFGVQKFSLQDCPKILLYLFEEDTLFFLSVGTLWLEAVYEVVIFVSEICQFYICQKSIKLLKIRKILDLLSNSKIVHRNYCLSCVLSIKISRGRVCYFFNFQTIFK